MDLKDIPIIYTLETTGVAGGHKVVFEHVNKLHALGYNVHLWALGGQPNWFPLSVKVGTYAHYGTLQSNLRSTFGIKVATWWKTAKPVYNSCINNSGIPFYLVQDLETSYYSHLSNSSYFNEQVIETYSFPDMNFLTTSPWVTDNLEKLRIGKTLPTNNTQVYIGLDLDVFEPNKELVDEPIIVTIGRTNPLKNFPMTVSALNLLRREIPSVQLEVFGMEGDLLGNNATYHHNLTDGGVADVYKKGRVFVGTSRHEGYNLTVLEAMASGCPVVTTLSDGNNHYCKHEYNCLVVEQDDVLGLKEAIVRLLSDDELATKLRENGLKTAQEHKWERSINLLIGAFENAVKNL